MNVCPLTLRRFLEYRAWLLPRGAIALLLDYPGPKSLQQAGRSCEALVLGLLEALDWSRACAPCRTAHSDAMIHGQAGADTG